MSTLPGPLHDPLVEKRTAIAETLNRRRQTASETSKKVAEDRNAFFDRLALLNAGALTFSVTLLGTSVRQHPQSLLLLYVAWASLLVALFACLLRNLSHQGYVFSDAAAKRAESEIAYIEVDSEIVSTKSIVYADSAEPFDKERELKINKENREVWQKELTRIQKKAERNWQLVVATEWIARIAMLLGFVLLIVFAVANSSGAPAVYPLHTGPD
jgi:uncharacterized integral membrane protein